jgi:hypothetical protein
MTAHMTPAQFRKIVLGLEGAVEASHMSHPDFRAANGRIFASLTEDEKRATAALTPDQQADLQARAPETFIPAAGAWGRGGWTMIELKNADVEIVGEAMTLAWQRIASLPAAKKKAKAAKARKPVSKPRSRSRSGR